MFDLTKAQKKIISILLKHKIKVELCWDEDLNIITFKINGFFKTGNVILFPGLKGAILASDRVDFWAQARYDEVTAINSIGDLIQINHDWWCRFGDGQPPDSQWIPLLLSSGLVKKTEEVVTTYT